MDRLGPVYCVNRSLSPPGLLVLLTGLNLVNYLDRYVVSAVLTPMQAEFHLNDSQLGLINSIFMLGYFLTSPIFGWLGDIVSRKWLIAIGIFVWSLGTVLTGYALSFSWLLAFRVLVGVGEASYATISPSLIADAFTPARRNNALTIFYVAIPVGAALGNILGSQIAAHQGWRSAFIWAGGPGLLFALILLPFREPARGQAEGLEVEKPRARDFLHLLLLPRFHLVVWGYTAYTFALGAFGFWGPTFLHRIHGVDTDQAGTFFGSALVAAGLVGTLIGGFAATAWQKRHPAGYARMLALSVGLAIPATVAAFLAADRNVAMSCLVAAMLFIFLCTGPVNTLIIETVPVNLRASAMAVSIFLIHLCGDMWSSQIVGHLSDRWNSLQKAILILPVALALAAGLWLILALRTKPAPAPATPPLPA